MKSSALVVSIAISAALAAPIRPRATTCNIQGIIDSIGQQITSLTTDFAGCSKECAAKSNCNSFTLLGKTCKLFDNTATLRPLVIPNSSVATYWDKACVAGAATTAKPTTTASAARTTSTGAQAATTGKSTSNAAAQGTTARSTGTTARTTSTSSSVRAGTTTTAKTTSSTARTTAPATTARTTSTARTTTSAAATTARTTASAASPTAGSTSRTTAPAASGAASSSTRAGASPSTLSTSVVAASPSATPSATESDEETTPTPTSSEDAPSASASAPASGSPDDEDCNAVATLVGALSSNCGKVTGGPQNDPILTTGASSANECALECDQANGCVAFGFEGGHCALYDKKISAMSIGKDDGLYTFFDQSCYTVKQCPS